jgi:hypothetical protein
MREFPHLLRISAFAHTPAAADGPHLRPPLRILAVPWSHMTVGSGTAAAVREEKGDDRRVVQAVPAQPQGSIGDARAILSFGETAIAQDTIKAARSSRHRLFTGCLQAALRLAKACNRPTALIC